MVYAGVFLTARCCNTRKPQYFVFHEDGALARTRVGILYVICDFRWFCVLLFVTVITCKNNTQTAQSEINKQPLKQWYNEQKTHKMGRTSETNFGSFTFHINKPR